MTTQAMDAARDGGSVPGTAARTWGGRAAAGIGVLFLAFDGVAKVAAVAPVREAMVQLGWAAEQAPVLGVVLLACLALYLAPRTAVLGAVLLTAYLGGAVATHVRVGSPLATHTLFPVYVALLLWGGLYLREPRLAALLPLRRS